MSYVNIHTEIECGRLIKVTITGVCCVLKAIESFSSLKICSCFCQNFVMLIRFHKNITLMAKYIVGQGLSPIKEKQKHLMRAANA
jgi:hypothetical protein